jgi:hypothetical protein
MIVLCGLCIVHALLIVCIVLSGTMAASLGVFHEGALFNSFNDLQRTIESFEKSNFVKLYRRRAMLHTWWKAAVQQSVYWKETLPVVSSLN